MATIEELDARVRLLEATVASPGTMLPPRAYTPEEVAELRAALGEGGADETITSALTYRDVPDALVWFDSIFATYGGFERRLADLPHNVLMTIPLYAPVSGPWPCKAPQPFPGYIGPTTVPTEILSRALIGQSWAGDAPCGEHELARRTAIRDKVATGAPGAQADWYLAAADAVTVLVMGTGFSPYSHDFQRGDYYPCPGTYSLDGVCAAITGGKTL